MSRRGNAGAHDSFSLGDAGHGESSHESGGGLNVGIGGYGDGYRVGASDPDSKYGRKFRPQTDLIKKNAQTVLVAVGVIVFLLIVWRAQKLQYNFSMKQNEKKILESPFWRFKHKQMQDYQDSLTDEQKQHLMMLKYLDKNAMVSKPHRDYRRELIMKYRKHRQGKDMASPDERAEQFEAKKQKQADIRKNNLDKYLELDAETKQKKDKAREVKEDRRKRNQKLREIEETGSTMTDAEEAAIKAAHDKAMAAARAEEAAAKATNGDAGASGNQRASDGDDEQMDTQNDEREQRLREREAALLAREAAHRQMEAERAQEMERKYLEELYAKQQAEMMRMQQESQGGSGGGDAYGGAEDQDSYPGHPSPGDVVGNDPTGEMQ